MKKLGEVIKRIRKSQRMSQAELGRHLGRSPSHISHVEQGKYNSSLTIEEITKVGKLSNFSLADMLVFSGYIENENTNNKIHEFMVEEIIAKAVPVYHGQKLQGFFITREDYQSILSEGEKNKVADMQSFLSKKHILS